MRTKRIVGLFAVGAAAVTSGVALATSSVGLKTELVTRAAVAGQDDRRQLAASLVNGEAGDAAIVRATLDVGGTTGWHQHPEGSLVILKTGTMTVKEVRQPQVTRGPGATQTCLATTYDATTGSKAFFHTSGPHTFTNTGSTQIEFYVVYFAPRAAGLLIDLPVAPTACP